MNFLKPHPNTLLWWEQRKKCEQCKCVSIDARRGWRCTLTNNYCIDERQEGDCGANAVHFLQRVDKRS